MADCPRSWEAEAARDGRLDDEGRSAFDAHRSGCSACRRETEGLERLAARLRALDGGELDDLAVRRLRRGVVSRAQSAALRAEPRSPWPWLLAGTAVVAVSCAAYLGARRAASPPPVVAIAPPQSSPAPPAAPETSVDVAATRGATWSRADDLDTIRLRLDDGVMHVAVRRPPGGKRVIVDVPDGELEDIGTTFEVGVAEKKTARLRVDEGRLAAQLAGEPPIELSAGQMWERPTVSHGEPASAPAPESSRPARPSDETLREDAAYLRVVRLLRAHRDDEARAAATDYLREFPRGFRRREVRQIADGQAP